MSGLWLPRAADSRWASDRPTKSSPSYVSEIRQTASQWNSGNACVFASTPRPDSVFLYAFNGNQTDMNYNGPTQTNVSWRLVSSYPSEHNLVIWLGFPYPGRTPSATAQFSNVGAGSYITQVIHELRVSPGFRGIPVQHQKFSGNSTGATITMDLDPAIDQHVWFGDINHNDGGSGITVPNIKPWLGGYGVLGGLWVASDRGRRKSITLAGTWGSTKTWHGVLVGLR